MKKRDQKFLKETMIDGLIANDNLEKLYRYAEESAPKSKRYLWYQTKTLMVYAMFMISVLFYADFYESKVETFEDPFLIINELYADLDNLEKDISFNNLTAETNDEDLLDINSDLDIILEEL